MAELLLISLALSLGGCLFLWSENYNLKSSRDFWQEEAMAAKQLSYKGDPRLIAER